MSRRVRYPRLRLIATTLIVALALFVWMGPVVAPGFAGRFGLGTGEGVAVRETFALCEGRGYAEYCVVDGDTLRIGKRRLRIDGIDAPEMDGECSRESKRAREARAFLLAWLNEGGFAMLDEAAAPRDRYERELQQLWRGEGLLRDYVADDLVEAGLAVRYDSHAPARWCD